MTNALTDSIEAAIHDVAAVADPVERYQAGKDLRSQLAEGDRQIRHIQRSAAEELKPGRSWAQVGELLGMTGSRAEQIAKGR